MKNTSLLHPQWTWAGFSAPAGTWTLNLQHKVRELSWWATCQVTRHWQLHLMNQTISSTASSVSEVNFIWGLWAPSAVSMCTRGVQDSSCSSGRVESCSVQFHVDLQSDPLSLPGCLWLSALKTVQWLKTPARDLETWDRSSPGTIRGMWWRCECGVHVCGAQKQNFRCVNKTSFNRSRVRSWNLRRLRRHHHHHLTVQQAGGNHTQVRPGESS